MLFIIGIGPGSRQHMTQRAVEALDACEVIVGYGPYIKMLGLLVDGKEIISTGMTKEIERCKRAVDIALEGRPTAIVSTGDAGVYGMAGPVLEVLEKADPEGKVEVEIVPGVSAANAAASLLGAPLMTDYAVISLSDLLTPWEQIEKRLEAAASADFALALYNPKSRKRIHPFFRAVEIISKHRSPDSPVGVVRNALRDGQKVAYTTLSRLPESEVDMMTIVIIGNSAARMLGGRLVAPRGYKV